MTHSKNDVEDADPLQSKLRFIRSIQIPTNEDLSLLIHFLADSNENEMICAAVYPILQKAGKPAADILMSAYSNHCDRIGGKAGDKIGGEDEMDEKLQIRFSYAFSQLSESPSPVFETFIQSKHPRVRQNGVAGFARLNDRRYDSLLFDLLMTDPSFETACEAAAALSFGGAEALKYFEAAMAFDLNHSAGESLEKKLEGEAALQKSYMASQTKIDADKANKTAVSKKRFDETLLDKHVLAKVIEISGDIGNTGTLPYLTVYLNHPDERISGIAAESIQKINSK